MTRLFTAAAFALIAAIGMATAQEAPVIEEMSLGSPDAPVTVIEYASFTCPHCANFHTQTFDQVRADYIDTGKLRWVYREVYFDRFGLWAAMVARCAGPERYFGVASMLYEKQGEWAKGDDPAAIADNLRRLGRAAGIDAAALDACLQDSAMAQALVAEYQKNAEADGISSTPSFVIDGEVYQNRPYEDLKQLFDEKLAG